MRLGVFCLAALVSCGGAASLIDITKDDAGVGAPNDGGDQGAVDCGTDDDCAVGVGPDAPQGGDDAGAGDRGTTATGLSCATGSECASGFCFDGLCCNADCSTACWSCAISGSEGTCVPAEVGSDPRDDCPDEGLVSCGRDGVCDGSGACRRYPRGAVCRQPTCSGSTLTQAYRCDGAGACGLTSGQPCDPYLCDPSQVGCLAACVTSADCVPGRTCVGGKCGRNSLGAACAVGDDCNSTICQQGVCCATACAGTCTSCALAGSAGTCTQVPQGQDPLGDCIDQTLPSCGTNGSCDGAGACQRYAANATCAPSTCVSSVFTATSTCDGVGTCHTPVSLDCGLYQCGAAGCKTTCVTSADCTAPNVCFQGACGAPTNLKVQYYPRAIAASSSSLLPQLLIMNLGATAIPLSQLTIRYWYTIDGLQGQSAAIDYADIGGANVTKTFVQLPAARPLADFYLQIGFLPTAGSLAGGGGSTGQIQVRFNKNDFSAYNQSNDYSFDPSKLTFADWTKVTLYRGGDLVWGIEPVAP